MRNFKTLLSLLLVIGLCLAETAEKKTNKEKEIKEKRDTVSAPYSYDVPQKSFHVPSHISHQQQQKYTNVDQQTVYKVVPLENPQGKQEISVAPIQESVQQYHPTTFHQSLQYAPESSVAQAYKGYGEYAFAAPNYESFSQMPILHYNGDLEKLTSSVINIPGYTLKSVPAYSSYKANPTYTYSHAPYVSHPSPVMSSANYPRYSSHYQSVPQTYAATPYSYVQQHPNTYPTTYYVQKTVVPKPSKIPEYASGSKGLGQFSSHTVAPIAYQHPSNSYVKHEYDSSVYTQTERPFKPSAFLGASQVAPIDSYPHSGVKLINQVDYSAPSKHYLPTKESYPTHAPQIEYQIQYVSQQQPIKSPSISNSYLPPKIVSHEVAKNVYITSTTAQPPHIQIPSKHYLPAIEKPASTYLPQKSSYPQSSPYHAQQYHSAPAQASSAVQHNYQPQETYESAEYQNVVSQSGHK